MTPAQRARSDGGTVDPMSTTRAEDLDNDGDCHYSADLNSCANANAGAVDSDGDDCRYYDAFPSDCGIYDDDTFSASAMCCACGGGQEAFDAESVIPPLGEHTWEMYCSSDSSICTDSADGVGDSGGDGCEYYWGYPSECGDYDCGAEARRLQGGWDDDEPASWTLGVRARTACHSLTSTAPASRWPCARMPPPT